MEENAERKRVVLGRAAEAVMEVFLDGCAEVLCHHNDYIDESKLKQNDKEAAGKLNYQEPPVEFLCPISGILMKDPVLTQSGQTFDARSIKWIQDGHQILPKDSDLVGVTPNDDLNKRMEQWRELQRLASLVFDLTPDLTPQKQTEQWRDIRSLTSLLEKPPRPANVKKIRGLTTKPSSVIPHFFGVKTGAISRLLNSSSIHKSFTDASMQGDLVATVFIILHDKHNRGKIKAPDPAVHFLAKSLTAQSSETRRHAAASLYLLSTLESNQRIIGESGAIRPLIDLVKQKETDPKAAMFARAALCNVCALAECREDAVTHGAVTAALGKITRGQDRIFVDRLNLPLLAVLSSHAWGIEDTEATSLLHCLFAILREEATTISKRSEEQIVLIAHRLRLDMRKVENGRQTLERIAATGRTATAKDKARELLVKLAYFWME